MMRFMFSPFVSYSANVEDWFWVQFHFQFARARRKRHACMHVFAHVFADLRATKSGCLELNNRCSDAKSVIPKLSALCLLARFQLPTAQFAPDCGNLALRRCCRCAPQLCACSTPVRLQSLCCSCLI